MEDRKIHLHIGTYGALVRDSEQLRILKNYVELADVYSKDQISTLIKAMEAEQ